MGENLIYIMYIFAIAGIATLLFAGYKWWKKPDESIDLVNFDTSSMKIRRDILKDAKIHKENVEIQHNPPSEYRSEKRIKLARQLREQHKDQAIY